MIDYILDMIFNKNDICLKIMESRRDYRSVESDITCNTCILLRMHPQWDAIHYTILFSTERFIPNGMIKL